MRDSFIFYRSFFEAVSYLDKEAQADCFSAICEYVLNEKEVELDGAAKALFISIKPQLDANNKRYENGCKGGRKKNEPEEKAKENQKETKAEPKENQKETEVKANENENVNVNDNENENENINPLTPFQGEQVSPKKKKIKYGQYRKVMLTDDEYKRLVDDFGLTVVHDAINFLDNYIEEKGYKSKSHNLTIRRWVIDAVTKQKQSPPPRGATDWDKIV
jgi:hypothetical protein